MALQVHDTLRGEKVPFKPLEEGKVKMYVCGLTPQDRMHVGHLRTYVAYDIMRRWLEHRGYDVHHVQNITDVEDKLIAKGHELDREPMEIAEENHAIARRELEALRVLPAHDWPTVSGSIDGIIQMTQDLLDNGHAYVGDEPEGVDDARSVYYDVSSFDDYGKLSGTRPSSLDPDASDGPEEDETELPAGKRHPADFALWKAAKEDEPMWDSPWGKGRPGWHIECSVMSSSILGPQFDIHGGGQDLIFPHHENEIAQTEGASGVQPTARHWIHTGFLTIDGEKMSKSLGNFVTAGEALEEWGAETLRLWLVGTHYRSPVDLSDQSLQQAQRNLERIRNMLRHTRTALDTARTGDPTPDDEAFLQEVQDLQERFEAAMDNDFNTPEALASLLELVGTVNRYADADPHRNALEEARDTVTHLGDILAILPEEDEGSLGDAEPFIDLLVDARERARDAGEYELADRIRDGLAEEGITVEDTDQGPVWHRS